VVTNMLVMKNWSEAANGYRLLAVNPIGEGLVEIQLQTEWKDGRRDVGMEVLKRFGNEWKALVCSIPIDESRSTWAYVHAGQLDADGGFFNGIRLDK
jgi:hypothetical protein